MGNVVKSQNEVTVFANGEAFISQTKVAELCGVKPHAISQWISKTRDNLNLNEYNQLDAKALELVIAYYAFDSQRTTKKAKDTARMFMKAGAKAYLYHEAGYTLTAEKQKIDKPIPSLMQYRPEVIRPIVNQHAVLMELVDLGILDVSIKTTKRYKYEVTEYGEMLGYSQNVNGTVLEPKDDNPQG